MSVLGGLCVFVVVLGEFVICFRWLFGWLWLGVSLAEFLWLLVAGFYGFDFVVMLQL